MNTMNSIWAKACPQPIGVWDDLWKLHQAGVPTRALMDIGAIDVGINNGRWVERFRGDRATVIPVCDDDGELVDLVAFRLATPRSFWTHEGSAVLLGNESLAWAEHYREPLVVHETPLDWLRARKRGVVILDWQHYWPLLLSGIPALRCMSAEFGRRLQARLLRPFATPEIQVAVA